MAVHRRVAELLLGLHLLRKFRGKRVIRACRKVGSVSAREEVVGRSNVGYERIDYRWLDLGLSLSLYGLLFNVRLEILIKHWGLHFFLFSHLLVEQTHCWLFIRDFLLSFQLFAINF